MSFHSPCRISRHLPHLRQMHDERKGSMRPRWWLAMTGFPVGLQVGLGRLGAVCSSLGYPFLCGMAWSSKCSSWAQGLSVRRFCNLQSELNLMGGLTGTGKPGCMQRWMLWYCVTWWWALWFIYIILIYINYLLYTHNVYRRNQCLQSNQNQIQIPCT